MASYAWTRKWISPQQWTSAQQSVLIVKCSAGQAIVRNHLAWGFTGTTTTLVNPMPVATNLAALGLVTTIGPGTETPPDAVNAAGNAAPPSQRWLYWSARAPVVKVWDTAHYTAIWENSRPEERGSVEGQVLAPSGMGGGNTLNLWMTWDTLAAWDTSGACQLWCVVETLVRGT